MHDSVHFSIEQRRAGPDVQEYPIDKEVRLTGGTGFAEYVGTNSERIPGTKFFECICIPLPYLLQQLCVSQRLQRLLRYMILPHMAPSLHPHTTVDELSRRSRPPWHHPAHIRGKRSFRSLFDLKLYAVALAKQCITRGTNGPVVDENVLAIEPLDEAIPFGTVEPLHCSLFHGGSLSLEVGYRQSNEHAAPD
jgi:hypothetical protein